MEFDAMVGPVGWSETADLARIAERMNASGLMFTETGQTPWMSIAAATVAAPSLHLIRDRRRVPCESDDRSRPGLGDRGQLRRSVPSRVG